MHKSRIFIDIPRAHRRQVGVVELLAAVRRQMNFHIRQFTHLAVGNAAPVAGYHRIHALEAISQIHHRHIELRTRAALQKQHFIVIGNIHQLAQILLGMIENAHKHIRAMAHGHHRKAGAVVIKHLALRRAQHRIGQNSGACGKIVNRGLGHNQKRFQK